MAAQLEAPYVPLVPLRAGVVEYAAVLAGRPARERDETFATGLGELDHVLGGGLRRKQVTVVLASTSAGKSSFVEQIALEVAQTHRVKFDAHEMGRARTTSRLLAKIMRLDEVSVNNLLHHRPDHPGLRDALARLAFELHIMLDERSEAAYTIDHLRHFAAEASPDLLVIDDLQCLDGWDNGMPGVPALAYRSHVVDKVLDLAKVLDCHILIPHQTKGAKGGHEASRRPIKDDCADIIKLVRRADNVLALHRPLRGKVPVDDVAELLVLKNRANGKEPVLHFYRNERAQRLEEMTTDEIANVPCCQERKRK